MGESTDRDFHSSDGKRKIRRPQLIRRGDQPRETSSQIVKRKNEDSNEQKEVPAKRRFGELQVSEGGRPQWSKLRQEKKVLKKKRKIKESKPGIYELSQEAKQIWEDLRPESCPANKKAELSLQLYTMLAPHIQKVVFTHDVVRVIECLVAVGGQKIRDQIFETLKADFPLLMKSTYSHFLILKLLKYGSKAQRDQIMKSFEGQVVSLVKHKHASTVVECAYSEFANSLQRFKIIKEFYGPEFRVFTDLDCLNLKSVLEKHPAKRQGIMNNMREVILKLLEKESWKLTMLHTLLYEFLSNCDSQARTDLIPLVIRGVCEILHTKDGARVAMICIWYGTVKDRKQLIKTLKPYVDKICREEHGHMVFLALFDCVDDTALVGKAIIQEITKNLESLMENVHARKVLHYILTPKASQHFHPNILSILSEGDGKSKKESAIRQNEILMAAHPDFIEQIASHAKAWTENNGACLVISSALLVGTENKTPAFKAIVKLATETPTKEFIEKPSVFKLMKNLISQQFPENSTFESDFTTLLVKGLTTNVVENWISCNRGCFLLEKILECRSGELTQNLLEILRPLKKKIKSSKDIAGAKMLLALIKRISDEDNKTIV